MATPTVNTQSPRTQKPTFPKYRFQIEFKRKAKAKNPAERKMKTAA